MMYVDTVKLFHESEYGGDHFCSICNYMGISESPYKEKVKIVGWEDDDPELEWFSDRNLVNDQLKKNAPEWSEPENCIHISGKGMVAPKSYRTAEIKLDNLGSDSYTVQVTRFVYPELNDKMPLIPATTIDL